MKRLVLLSLATALLWSCTGSKSEEASTLQYEMKTIRVESKGGCGQEARPCASFEVTYPEFRGLRSQVQEILLNKINLAIAYDNPEIDGFSIEEMGHQFVSDFENFQQNFPDAAGGSWYFKTLFEVNVATDTLISMAADTEFYSGGAHGGYVVYFVSIDPRNGDEVTLHHLFKPGFENRMDEEAERAFRQARGYTAETDLEAEGFSFPDGRFAFTTNYGFSSEGVVFFYNSYEIGPYSLGPTEIVVPWEALSEWRR